jgi:DMSO/TMAO reductase YedYZ molybdopterin-dependent catalytic subunit
MQDIMEMVRPKPEAKFAAFVSFAHGPDPGSGRFYDVHRVASMYHPQTILAYEMNGEPLKEPHGAPIRLRNELEVGFKQVKWVQSLSSSNPSQASVLDMADTTKITNTTAGAIRFRPARSSPASTAAT